MLAGGKGENAGREVGAGLFPGGAGGRGRIHLGGCGSALERQGALGILLAFSPGLKVSALLLQIRGREGMEWR